MLLIKRKKKRGLKSNPGLVLIGLCNNWALVFFGSNSKSHNHFEVSQWYITWACVTFPFCHLIIVKPRVAEWAGISNY